MTQPVVGEDRDAARAGLTAVLIDDIPEVRLLLRVALEDVGIEVVGEAADGASGVEITALRMPDIVVLDVSMPIMDGIAALPWIRDTVPDAKIVMLSAYDRNLAGGPEASSAADAYVEKGHVDVLIRTVLSLCGQELDALPTATPPSEVTVERRALDSDLAERSLLAAEHIPAQRPGLDSAAVLEVRRFPLTAGDEAELARETLQELARMAAHDLAEPVSLVVGFSDRLAARWGALDLEPRDREFVAFTTAAATRLQLMIDALTEYLRACTEPLDVEALDPIEVMQDVVGALTRLIRDSGGQITTNLPDCLVANRFMLTTTLRHLVQNSLMFARAGTAPVIEVGAVRDGNRWLVRVDDNGVGVDPRDTERVFRPYKHLSNDEQPGCGMGLAICRQLIRRHGGEIVFRSREGSGSHVEFSLPFQPAAER